MQALIIDSAEVFVLGPDVPRCRLAADMGEVYETLTLIRLQTLCGLVGFAGVTTYSEHCFDEALGAALKSLLPALIGQDARHSEVIWQHMMGRYNCMTPRPQSAIDIALWDLKAKALDMPLYRLLGGERDNIRSYASTPLLDSPADYVAFVRDLQSQGFTTVKFHVSCELAQDLALLDAIEQAFGDELSFMIDLEERYNRDDALVLAKRLETMPCVWLEAPLPDSDLVGYAALRKATSVAILPAGNTLLSPDLMVLGIEQAAWDGLRMDVTYAGGITGGRAVAALAQQHNLPLELQSWGYTPTQAANLHLMLSISHAMYFEQAVPYASHEAFCSTPIRTQNGFVYAPKAAGLGIEMDWPQVQAEAFWRYKMGGV